MCKDAIQEHLETNGEEIYEAFIKEFGLEMEFEGFLNEHYANYHADAYDEEEMMRHRE